MAKFQPTQNEKNLEELEEDKKTKDRILDKILNRMEKENISYLSDTANDWFYNEIMLLKPQEKLILEDEILSESEFIQFFRKNFYSFEYKPSVPRPPFRDDMRYVYDSYDRKPFVLVLKRKKNIIHGLNLNYLYRKEKNNLMNFLFRFLRGDIMDPVEEISKIMVDYKLMKLKDWVHWHKLIYRRYDISRINNPRVVPIRYAKLFSFLESSRFRSSKNKIYRTSFYKLRKERTEQHQGKES
jgi:hypothetical protein